MFMDRKVEYHYDVNTSQSDVQIQCNSYQNPSNFFLQIYKNPSENSHGFPKDLK